MKNVLLRLIQFVLLIHALGCAAVDPSGFDNLALGSPGKADVVVDREGFAVGFSIEKRQALWVIYKLTAEELADYGIKRSNRFRHDPKIPASAYPKDYANTGYDRGHLAPARDMAFSLQTMKDSFLMSNMSPQKPGFNRGIWKRLEDQVRQFALTEKEIYVVTGALFKENPKTMNGIPVPYAFFKIVFDLTPPQKMLGFIMPNEESKRPLRDFTVTVDAVEKETGLDFFQLLPLEQQNKLEATITISAWQWNNGVPKMK